MHTEEVRVTSAESFCGKTDSHHSTHVQPYANLFTANVQNEVRNPPQPQPPALHAEVAGVVFPVEATLLSWMTNTSTLEVERRFWGAGMCFPTFHLLVSFPEYFIILVCHFEHHWLCRLLNCFLFGCGWNVTTIHTFTQVLCINFRYLYFTWVYLHHYIY